MISLNVETGAREQNDDTGTQNSSWLKIRANVFIPTSALTQGWESQNYASGLSLWPCPFQRF